MPIDSTNSYLQEFLKSNKKISKKAIFSNYNCNKLNEQFNNFQI